ncbi:hypothetical protein BEL04_08375 [Mucilaginibacter sp. PPCGB 2223]|uniref:hypothetical protein n=1 Tax=Mucilaginibacter sp. PPCGB 2223 TaxID=1886027 RepID=UPI0008257021|nr:hypothetical protein [Mucilaginibacter sp. PPCGB 2223]OCX54263.1 hypothetical protein BEL04_08375 [Mucilaginibacter sp. PPCGB 2223]
MKQVLIILRLAFSVACTNPSSAAHAQTRADTVLICKSKSAHAYHLYECRGLKNCTYTIIKLPKTQAIKLGYRACKICCR